VTTADEPNMNTIAKAEVPGLIKARNPIQIVVLIAVSIVPHLLREMLEI